MAIDPVAQFDTSTTLICFVNLAEVWLDTSSPYKECVPPVSLLLKVACPECGHPHEAASLGAELRCTRCGRDFRAQGDGDNASRVLSVTPDELDNLPYSQRTIEVPVNSVSSIIVADPALLNDKLLRDTPLKDNARWVGKVRILKKLGQGGMGAVYRGYDEALALDVAVKILPLPMVERDAQFVARFRQEARISAQINHPNVVRTLHVDEQGDLIYLVMDYIQGTTARGLVDQRGPLNVPLALQIMQDATRGVQAAHEQGVIHRDIKPDNILVADDGRVLLSDLGLAKAVGTGGTPARMPVTRMGLLLGTPHYMSPEQWNIGAQCGPAADIWSIGATLWMLLTRMPPYDDKDTGLLAQMIKEAPLPDIRAIRQGLPDSVVDILHFCMQKKPEDRFPDCKALVAAFDWVLNDLSSGNGNGSLPRPTPLSKTPSTSSAVTAASAISIPAPVATPPKSEPRLLPPTSAISAPISAIANATSDARRTPAWAQPVSPPPPSWQPVPQKSRSLAWVAAPAAALLLGGVAIWQSRSSSTPASLMTSAPLSVELRCSGHVKPGEPAELTAVVSGGDAPNPSVVWTAGEHTFPGASVRVPIETDTEFTVIVRDRANAELARRSVKVDVDLEPKAAGNPIVKAESGSALKLEGKVRGGSDPKEIETRWVDAASPDKVLATSLVLTLAENEMVAGQRVLQFQARRKGAANWTDAPSDRVQLLVSQRIPPEYQTLLKEAKEAQDTGAAAETGIEAAAEWRRAIAALEKAKIVFPAGDADSQLGFCHEHLDLNERYLKLLAEARKLKQQADQLPLSDGVGRLSTWSEACRPYSAALALFDRSEVRFEASIAQAKVEQLKNELVNAEQVRAEYDSGISKARHSASEGKKYLSAAVALPHWENALEQFTQLSRKFPRRAAEFELELQDVQENRDRAYLQVAFGVIPATQKENKQPDVTPPKKAAIPAPLATRPVLPEPKATPRAPQPRIPEPVHGEESRSDSK
jgi:serine/threonine protein kinase